MKKSLQKFFSLISVIVLLINGCMRLPETDKKELKSFSELNEMINDFPLLMMGTDQQFFYSNYGVHWDFGIGAIHIASEYMLEDMTSLGGEFCYNHFYDWYRNKNQGEHELYSAYFWNTYFKWIKAANDIINAIGPDDMRKDVEIFLGQAYTYRASFYLDLARFYEPKKPGVEYPGYDVTPVLGLTVPIVDEHTTEEESKNNPRVDRETMYKFILSDLDKAAEYLKETNIDYTQPSINVVNGLRARTYLEMGAYAEAAKYAKMVIDESGKTPLTQAQWEDPNTGFNDGSANNSWIWGLSYSYIYYNNIVTWTGHICPEAPWGYALRAQVGINKATYERIPDSDFRKHSWLDPGRKDYYDYKFSCGDDSFLNSTGNYRNRPVPNDYVSIKFRPAQGETYSWDAGNHNDLVLMRIEEMYFIEAEALANNNNLSGAKAVLETLIKTRNPKYTCNASSKEGFLDELLLQKRIEFWGEGILFFDYKRLGVGITRGYTGTNHPSGLTYNVIGRSPQWNIVIPLGEHQTNQSITSVNNNPDPSNLLSPWTE